MTKGFDAAPVANQIQAPAFVWPVAILTNTGGSNKPLTLSTETIAKIFAGKITRWDDAQIVADNNRPITTIIYMKNSDGSVKKDAKGAGCAPRIAEKRDSSFCGFSPMKCESSRHALT